MSPEVSNIGIKGKTAMELLFAGNNVHNGKYKDKRRVISWTGEIEEKFF